MELEYQFTAQEIIARGCVTEDNLNIIRNYVKQLDRKPVPKLIQDEVLVLFLISCENDIELTKKTIISFYECKKNGPEIFDERDMQNSAIQQALNTIHLSSLPVRTDSNDVIHFFRVNDTNYQNFDLVNIMKTSYMLIDVAHEKNPPNGLIVFIDAKGLGLMHMTRIKVTAIKKYIQFLQEGFPMKLREVHIINAPYFVDKVMEIVKVFMKSELMKLLNIYPPGMDLDKLFNLIPKKCLPEEYGGDLPPAAELHKVTMEKFYAKQKFWNVEEAIRKQAH